MPNIDFGLTNVAGIAVAPIDASATISTGGLGGVSVFAGVVACEQGPINKMIRVTSDNWREILGNPFPLSAGSHAEGLRQMAEALEGGDGYVSRVMPTDASFPLIRVYEKKEDDDGNPNTPDVLSTAAQMDAMTYDNFPGEGGTAANLSRDVDFLLFWPIDGTTCENRRLSLTKNDAESEVNKTAYDLRLYDKDSRGTDYILESHIVSFHKLSVDGFGKSNYIVDALSSNSKYINAAVGTKAIDPENTIPHTFSQMLFVDGAKKASGGTMDDVHLTEGQFDKAISILESSLTGFTAVLSLGQYKASTLKRLAKLADDRRVDAFFDISPNETYASAVTTKQTDYPFPSHRVCWYHFPYSAKDPYYSVQGNWGISGIAFVAKAKGVAKSQGGTGGWHYSPAGVERGVITRSGVKVHSNVGTPDYMLMYTNRINKIGVTPSGMLMIDDAITGRPREDYLRFQHVSSLMDAISRRFYALASQIKHEPDGITRKALVRGMTAILDDFVSIGALVTPRNPEDGAEPYVLKVKQNELDMWTVGWDACPVGVARRIQGEPALIR